MDTILTVNRFWKRRRQEHEAGWIVLLGEERIAALDYLHDDQPVHLFQARLLIKDSDKIDYALRNTERQPEDKVQFRCRAGNVVVSDGEFFVNLRADGRVSVRDMRPGPELSTSQRIWQTFISEMFAPLRRLRFYCCAGLAAIAGAGVVVVADLRPESFLWLFLICAVMLVASRALIVAILRTNHQTDPLGKTALTGE